MRPNLTIVKPPPPPPCPSWTGRRVSWEEWEPQIWMTHVDNHCPECRSDQIVKATGTVHPLDGDQVQSTKRVRHRTGGYEYERAVLVRAWPVRTLYASRCLSCGWLDVVVLDGRDGRQPTILLCDGCDRACAVGADDDEARGTLVGLGGWTAGGGADWDRCPECAP